MVVQVVGAESTQAHRATWCNPWPNEQCNSPNKTCEVTFCQDPLTCTYDITFVLSERGILGISGGAFQVLADKAFWFAYCTGNNPEL